MKESDFFRFLTPFGLLMGVIFSIATYAVYYRQGVVYGNVILNNSITILMLIGIFMRVRSYREQKLGGIISYGRALAASMWVLFVALFILMMFTILLYMLYPELLESYLNMSYKMIEDLYKDNESTQKFFKDIMALSANPVIIGVADFISKLIMGFIYTLMLSFVLKRKNVIY